MSIDSSNEVVREMTFLPWWVRISSDLLLSLSNVLDPAGAWLLRAAFGESRRRVRAVLSRWVRIAGGVSFVFAYSVQKYKIKFNGSLFSDVHFMT